MLVDEIKFGESVNIEFKREVPHITNTISDMCCPQIFPNIGVNTIEGKCVIVINIYPGANRPYLSSHLEKRQALTSEYRERPDPLMKRS